MTCFSCGSTPALSPCLVTVPCHRALSPCLVTLPCWNEWLLRQLSESVYVRAVLVRTCALLCEAGLALFCVQAPVPVPPQLLLASKLRPAQELPTPPVAVVPSSMFIPATARAKRADAPSGGASPLARKVALSRLKLAIDTTSHHPAPVPVAASPIVAPPLPAPAPPLEPRTDVQGGRSSRPNRAVSSLLPALSPIAGSVTHRDARSSRGGTMSALALPATARSPNGRGTSLGRVRRQHDPLPPPPEPTPLSKDVLSVLQRVRASGRVLGGGQWPPKLLPHFPVPKPPTPPLAGNSTSDDAAVIRAMTPLDSALTAALNGRQRLAAMKRSWRHEQVLAH